MFTGLFEIDWSLFLLFVSIESVIFYLNAFDTLRKFYGFGIRFLVYHSF